jgi:uncharacterized membrane protein YccC
MSALASTWRRVRAPGAAAVHRALRVALAATLGFALGRYGLDDAQTAVYATLTPVALLALGEVGGPRSARVVAIAIAIVAAAAAAVLGTLASDDTLAASLTLFAGALVASLAGIAGSNAAGLSRSVLLVLVVSAGIPAPDSAIPDRLLGVAIGGALAVSAAALLWPERDDVDFRRRLGAALETVAELAGAIGAASGAEAVAGGVQRADVAIADVRAFALGTTERPLGAARVAAAERRLATGIGNARDLLAGLDGELGERDRAALRAVAVAFGDAAGRLRDGNAAPPDVESLARARATYDAGSGSRLAELLARGASPEVIAHTGDRVFQVRRLVALAAAVVGQARIAAGLDDPEPARSATRRLVGQLGIRLAPDSVLLHNALRLALGLAAARAIAGAFDLEHGFWVVFATLTVTRASAHGTGATAARAVLGTAIGAALATALLFVFEAEADVYLLLLPLFAFAAVYGSAVSFLYGQVGFTLLIVRLFNLITPARWEIALIRLEDVAIGAVVGLAIGVAGVAARPGGAAARRARARDRRRRRVQPRGRIESRPAGGRTRAGTPTRGLVGTARRGRVHRLSGGGRRSSHRDRPLERAARAHASAVVRGERRR